jgi:hypothetical protein
MGVAVRIIAVRKISPRRPSHLFSGSTMKAPMRPAVKKMMELIRPTIHSFLSVVVPSGLTRPNSSGKDKLAPLEPV